MAEEAQARVSQAIKNLISDLDRTCLRKLQADMHRCAAKCCDDQSATMETTHRCVGNCSNRVNQAQNIIEKELSFFQQRLERCVLQCQDDIKEKMGANAERKDFDKYTGEFENCVLRCADDNLKKLPSISDKIKEQLKKT